MANRNAIWNGSIPEPNTGCWLWLGYVDHRGYGRINRGGENRKASRISWEAFNDRHLGANELALHRCDNPGCVNPEHIFAGTHLDNMRDMVRKGRHWNSKLTPAAVRNVRSQLAAGHTAAQLAAEYGVDRATIRRAANGSHWNPVEV